MIIRFCFSSLILIIIGCGTVLPEKSTLFPDRPTVTIHCAIDHEWNDVNIDAEKPNLVILVERIRSDHNENFSPWYAKVERVLENGRYKRFKFYLNGVNSDSEEEVSSFILMENDRVYFGQAID